MLDRSSLGCPDGSIAEPPSVLLVDDDPGTCDVVVRSLEREGFGVVVATSMAAARTRLSHYVFDLVVVDLVLPDGDGLDLIAELQRPERIPVVAVTGRSAEGDRVMGLRAGADDYVVKPFSPVELTARIAAVLRRTGRYSDEKVLSFDDVEIDLRSLEAYVRGEQIALTRKEFDLLVALASRPRRACSHQELLEWVWESSEEYQDPATVTEHIRRLRRKLGDDAVNPRHVVTVRGRGYRWEP